MASTALQKFYAQGKRAEDTLRRMREREKKKTSEFVERAGSAVAGVGGVLLAGVIDGKWGHDNKSLGSDYEEKFGIAHLGPLPINSGVGLVALAVGIPGFLPGSEYIAQFGAAMFAYPLAKMAEGKIVENAESAAK